jgi:hypothetical protein
MTQKIMRKGILYGTKIARTNEFCFGIQDDKPVRMSMSEAQNKLGHMSYQRTKLISKELGWTLTGAVNVYKACSEGKARQKNIMVKIPNLTTMKNSGRMHLDISSVRNNEQEDGGQTPKPYWRTLVDERTQIKFSDFVQLNMEW